MANRPITGNPLKANWQLDETVMPGDANAWAAAINAINAAFDILVTFAGGTFTGTVNGLTPPQFDNSRQVATTEFVQRAAGNMSGVTTLTGLQTLTAAHAGKLLRLVGLNTQITLPNTNCGTGTTFYFYGFNSTATISVPAGKGDSISLGGEGLTSVTIGVGDTLTLVYNADIACWIAESGSLTLLKAAVMAGTGWTTPPQFANDTRLATTEFVQRTLGNGRDYINYGVNTSIPASDAGRLIGISSGGKTLTLPDTATLPAGATFLIMGLQGTASAASIIQRAGADIIKTDNTTNVTSLSIKAGDTAILRVLAGGIWALVGGTMQLQYSPQFARSLTSGSGWQALPGGMIIQWGHVSSMAAGATLDVTFAVEFPSTVMSVAASSNSSANYLATCLGFSPTGFTFKNTGTGTLAGAWYIALGY